VSYAPSLDRVKRQQSSTPFFVANHLALVLVVLSDTGTKSLKRIRSVSFRRFFSV